MARELRMRLLDAHVGGLLRQLQRGFSRFDRTGRVPGREENNRTQSMVAGIRNELEEERLARDKEKELADDYIIELFTGGML